MDQIVKYQASIKNLISVRETSKSEQSFSIPAGLFRKHYIREKLE